MNDALQISYHTPKNVLLDDDEALYHIKINGFDPTKKLYFSFEIYPENNPITKKRHLGCFISLLEIPKEGMEVTVSFKYPTARFIINGANEITPSDTWVGDFKEDGMYDVYFTLAQIEDGRSLELARKKVKQFMVFGASKVKNDVVMKLWSGKDRRTPSKYTQDFLTLNHISKTLQETIAGLGKKDLNVLDVGCNEKPYYPFFYGVAKNYIGLDIQKTPYSDVVGFAEQLPFCDGAFDFVICSQVLEHVVNPFKSAEEIVRVTKKGGTIFITAPMMWDIHQFPSDYWRFTPDGLKAMFKGVSKAEALLNGNSVQALIEKANGIIDRRVKSIFVKKKVFTIANFLIRKGTFFKDKLLPSNCILVAKK